MLYSLNSLSMMRISTGNSARLWTSPCLRLLAGIACSVALTAQIPGRNVNMVSGTSFPDGDPFLQRQNEPSLAVSSRNSLHLVAGANDYRAIDIPAVPGNETGDAWLGIFKSLDGGLTWKSTLLPGFPQDGSFGIPSLDPSSPLRGYNAAADPVVRAGTNGLFYLAGLSFNRGDNQPSAIFVTRFIDNNNNEKGDPIQYLNTTVVSTQTGAGALFLDKPWLAVDIPRAGAQTCVISGANVPFQSFPGGNVYLSYTSFVGNDEEQGQILFRRSQDCGVTWSTPVVLTAGSSVNQGATIAIDPGSGAVYVAWRRFKSNGVPDAILFVKSGDGGQTFTPPTVLATISPFDQDTSPTSFRTNAYPAMTVDAGGQVYVAWSQRGMGPGGDTRIVMTTSNGGQTWSVPTPIDNQPVRGHQIMPALTFAGGSLMMIYYDLRQDSTEGVFTPLGGGQYSEARKALGDLVSAPPAGDNNVFNSAIADAPLPAFPAVKRRHTIDVWAAQAQPGAVPVFNTARVSQYLTGSFPPNSPDPNCPNCIEQLQFNVPNLPLYQSGTVPFMGDYLDIATQMFVRDPSSGNWAFNTAPSTGQVYHAVWTDNRDVRGPANGDWTKYTPPFTVPAANVPANVFDPTGANPRPACFAGDAGMRDQNIYSARITQGLLTVAPANFKALSSQFQRAFPVTVWNTTGLTKTFRLTVANQPPGGRATFTQSRTATLSMLLRLDVTIAPGSSISRTVFIQSTNPTAPVRVNVAEITGPNGSVVAGGLQTFIQLNADPTNPANPDVANAEVYNPDVANPDVANPDVANPDVANPDVANPDVANPDVANPGVSNIVVANPDVANPDVANPDVANPDVANPDVANPNIATPDVANGAIVSDTTWHVTNNGNTNVSYTVKMFGQVPNAVKRQLILNKIYQTPVINGCTVDFQAQNEVLANIVTPNFSGNISTVGNPDVANPDVANASLTIGPGETVNVTARFFIPQGTRFDPTTVITSATSHAVNTQDLQSGLTQQPVGASKLVIVTDSLLNGSVGAPYSFALVSAGGNGAITWALTGANPLPPGLTLTANGQITGTPTTAGVFSFSVQAQDSSAPPEVAVQSLTLTITAPVPPSVTTPSAANGYEGVSYSLTLTSSGGTGAVAWSISAGSLPPGLNLVGNAITGVPLGLGTFAFTVRVSDSLGRVGTKALTIQIVPFTLVYAVAPADTKAGQTIALEVKAQDASGIGLPGISVSIAIGTNPSGGVLSGINPVVTGPAGIAIFSNLTINAPGVGYTLVASAIGATNAFSPAFNILLPGGIINTVAGRTWVPPAVSGLATSYPLGPPSGLAVDGAGNLYVSDIGDNLVVKVSPSGVVSPVAGTGVGGFSGDGGPATAAMLDIPTGLALDGAGDLYISDFFNNRVRKVTPGGTISTVAGDGIPRFNGDGQGTTASLAFPSHLAIDTNGNVYIADLGNHRIRKLTPGGAISTVAGNGTSGYAGDGGLATSASLNAPRGVAVDSAGRIYIADTSNNVVRRVDTSGVITTIAGNGIMGFGGDGSSATAASLAQPQNVWVDTAGNVLIADTLNHRIRKVTNGTITTIAGTSGGFSGDGGVATAAALDHPFNVIADSSGNIYISDAFNDRVRIVSANVINSIAGNGLFERGGAGGAATNAYLQQPSGVVVDGAGNFYIADQFNAAVRKVNAGGTITPVAGTGVAGYSGDGGPATAARLGGRVSNIALDGAGNLYIADTDNGVVRQVTPAGNIRTIAGNGSSYQFSGDGGPATAAALFQPEGVAVDAAGNLYIADTGNNRIRRVAGGIITTIAGNGTAAFSGDGGAAAAASLNAPDGVAVDAAFNVYIADSGNNRIRMVSPTGVITTVAGNGNSGYNGDGGPAMNASLTSLHGVAVDSGGNLYITTNTVVRKVDISGNITTVAGTGTFGFGGDGGPALSAMMNSPQGVSVDAAGDIFIADSGNGRIREVTAINAPIAGNRLTIITTSLPGATYGVVYNPPVLQAVGGGNAKTWAITGGALPAGLSLNSATGQIFGTPVGVGTFNFTVQVTSGTQTALASLSLLVGAPAGATLTFSVQPTNTSGGQTLNPPVQVTARDGASNPIPGMNITVAIGTNPAGGTLSGALTVATNGSGVATFNNLSIDLAGTGYTLVGSGSGVANVTSTPFNILLATGSITTIAGSSWTFAGNGGPAANAPVSAPYGVATDSAGNVYGTDFNNDLVYKVSPAGILTVIAGTGVAGSSGDGGPATSAQLNAPAGVWVDAANNVYIAEFFGNRIRKVTPAGIISTVAGNGVANFAGDGGPAPLASLNAPIAIITDAAGNLYIADRSNNRIRKVDTTGTITTIAGNGNTNFNGDGPATTISLSLPWGISFDPAGNLYIMDSGHTRIRRLSGGNLTTVAGTGFFGFTPDGSPALNAPLGNVIGGLLVDAVGNIYYSESARVRKINTTGVLSTIAGDGINGFSGDGGSAFSATIGFAAAITFDAAGNLYFGDPVNRRVRKVDTSGIISTFAGNGQFRFAGDGGPATSAQLDVPGGITLDSGGNILVADSGNTRVRKITPGGTISTVAGDGIPGFSGDGGPAVNASLGNSLAAGSTVAAGPAGSFFIADSPNDRVRRVDSLGIITDFAGNGQTGFSGEGGPATAAAMNPVSAQTDSAGNVYIVDATNNRIRMVSPAGVITTVAGNGTAGYAGDGLRAVKASLNGPQAVAVDSAGNLYISDTNNQRIRMVNASGIITTIAGTGTAGFSGDGIATQMSLNNPQGLTTDAAGNLYVADQNNQRVRKIDPTGIMTTIAGSGTAGFAGDGGPALKAELSGPISVALDGSGNLLISDSNNARIRKVIGAAAAGGPARLVITTTSVPAANAGVAYNFTLLATGGAGALTWSIPVGALPNGLTLNAATGQITGTATQFGDFVFLGQATDGVQTVTVLLDLSSNPAAGTNLVFVSQPVNTAAGQSIVPAIQVKAQDGSGTGIGGVNVTIDIGNDPSGGTLSGTKTVLTGANGVASFPNLSIDRAGNNYTLTATAASIGSVSSAFNVLPATGGIITVAGSNWVLSGAGGPATAAPIGNNQGIAVDRGGNVYIADTSNNMVFKISGGVLNVVAGTGKSGFAGDGGPATSAQLNGPRGVSLDAAGNIYISDTSNNRIRKIDLTGTINTIAGNGAFAFGGDNGPAVGASLRNPSSIAFDAAGNLYFADVNNNRVRMITPAGIITTVAGNGTAGYSGDHGPATAATLNFPDSVVFDTAGNLYIADSRNNAIRKVAGGTITTVAGGSCCFFGDGGPATGAGLNFPIGLVFDRAGNLYIADQGNERIRKIDTGGTIHTIAGNGLFEYAGDGGPATSASMANPLGVAFDSSGNLYVNDFANRRVRKIDTSGTITTVAGNGNFKFAGDGGAATSANLWTPSSVTVDGAGNLLIVDTGNARIRKVSNSGTITTIAGNSNFSNGDFSASGVGGPAVNSTLSNNPVFGVMDAAGNFYFSDTSNSRVLKIDTLGVLTTYAGNGTFTYSGDGGPATAAGLSGPFGLAFDGAGNLYIADANNNRVRKVDTSGTITTFAGNGTAGFSGDGGAATAAVLSNPRAVGVDASGNVYVADSGNNRVRVISPSGSIATIAGNGNAAFAGDGGAATSAALNFPAGLATDPGGNLYIADSNNGRVRRVNLNGTIATVAGGGASFGDGGPATSAQLSGPHGLVFDGNGNLFMADSGNDRIREVAGLGTTAPNSRLTITTASVPGTAVGAAYNTPLQAAGGSGVRTWSLLSGSLPGGVTLNASTGLLSGPVTGAGTFPFVIQVTDSGQVAYGSYVIQSELPGGSTISFTTQPGTAGVGQPLNPAPQVLVVDAMSNPIAGATVTVALASNPTGAILGGTTSAVTNASGVATFSVSVRLGGNGYTLLASVGSATATSQPFNVTAAAGNIITLAGAAWTFTGAGGPATNAPIAPDRGIVVDSGSNVIVADRYNHQIVKISPAGTLTVIAGTGVFGYSGDGGPATGAELNNPQGLALDVAGNLYIADGYNNRIRKIDTNGIITTIAGEGNYDFYGDGGPALAAAFRTASAVTVDGGGNVYVADQGNNRVRKISPQGIISTFAGTGTAGFTGDGGPAINAELNSPQGLALDGAGNLYIADNNNRIRIVTPAGTITTFAGSGVCCNPGDGGPATSAWFNGAMGLTFDVSGNLFFADRYDQRIRKITPGGTISTVAGGGGGGRNGFSGDGGTATGAQFDQPSGVAVDTAGNLYVIDSVNRRVRKVDTAGNITTIAGNALFNFNGEGPATTQFLYNPQGVAVDGGGNLYVSDNGNLRIRKVTPGGNLTTIAGNGIAGYTGDGGPSTAAQVGDFTTDVRVDSSGNLLIDDDNNGAIREITPAGTISSPVSGLNPRGIAVDAAGNTYVAEENNNIVIRVDSHGAQTTIAGVGTRGFSGDGGPATAAQLNAPHGVALDSAGNLYITDSNNNRIRRVTPGGIITTLAGSGVVGFSGDGGPATAATLNGYLQGIQVDAAGNVYFADINNNRIRKVDTTGIITTVAGSGGFGFSGDGGPATSARLASPWNIDLDAAGNLYIADTGNNRIREVLASGPLSPGARLTITTTQLAAALNTPVNLAVQSVGGSGALTWTVVGGSLPPGLALNNGQITGTATASGSFNITIQVQDSGTPQQVTEGIVALQVN